MSSQSYLMCRNGVYYFRISVPSHLISKLHRKEINISLKTKSRSDAKLKLSGMISNACNLFENLKTMVQITKEQADKLIRHYLRDQVENIGFIPNNLMSFVTVGAKMDKVKSHIDEYHIQRSDFDFLDGFEHEKINADNLKRFVKPYKHGWERNISHVYDSYQKDNGVKYMSQSAPDIALHSLMNNALMYLDEYKGRQPIKNLNQGHGDEVIEQSGKLISEVFNEYIDEVKRTLSKRYVESLTKTVKLSYEVFGDIPINQVKKADAKHFKMVLSKMPKHADLKYPDIKAVMFLNMDIPESDLMAINTINDYLARMKAFFNWANKNGEYHDANNPFNDLMLSKSKTAKDERDSFSDIQIKKIFSSPIYNGCKTDKQTGRYEEGQLIIKDFLYWIPLIGLFSGARLDEICQLTTNDIIKKDDIWCFDINDQDNKSIKNKSSIRLIPIHSKIIEQGFLEYVEERKKAKTIKVFDITSKAYSKRFSRFLEKLDAKTDKTSFHSFRHSMKDSLVENDVAVNIAKAIMGHSDSSVHGRYGSKSIPIKQLKNALEKVKYGFIKLP